MLFELTLPVMLMLLLTNFIIILIMIIAITSFINRILTLINMLSLKFLLRPIVLLIITNVIFSAIMPMSPTASTTCPRSSG